MERVRRTAASTRTTGTGSPTTSRRTGGTSVPIRFYRIFRNGPAATDDRIVRALATEFRPYRSTLVKVAGLASIGGLVEMGALAGLVALASHATGRDGGSLGLTIGPLHVEASVAQFAVLVLVLVLVRAALDLFEGFLSARLVGDYDKHKRLALYRAFLGAEWRVQAADKGGVLQEYSSIHITNVRGGLTAVTQLVPLMVNIAIMLGGALVIGPVAAVSTFGAMSLLLVVLRPLVHRAKVYAAAMGRIGPELAHHVNESVTLAREIRIFDAGAAMTGEADALTERYRFNLSRQLLLTRTVPAVTEAGALLVVVCGLGLLYVLRPDDIAPLAVVALLTLRALMYGRSAQAFWQLAVSIVPYIEGLEAQQRWYEQHRSADGSEGLPVVESLGLRGASFSYVPGDPVLHDLTFTIRRGESVGIVGPSGSGKSTVLQLLMRLRDPSDGDLRINGVAAGRYTLSSWYRRVAYVPQEPLLLNRTIKENIAFLRPLAADRIERAARSARIHDEVMTMPLGYDTVVGERGLALSGGQRQRIAIARALADDPDVVLLDEPTSALDVHSEALIQAALRTVSESRTLVIVAHRLSTLQACDKILVMSNGHLQAYGARTDLENDNPYYLEALRLSRLA